MWIQTLRMSALMCKDALFRVDRRLDYQCLRVDRCSQNRLIKGALCGTTLFLDYSSMSRSQNLLERSQNGLV
jgi:hypothetical protein